MKRAIILVICCIPFFSMAQTDLLILRKGGKQIHTYTVGDDLTMETVYQQWFQGTITEMRHDSVFLNGQPWDYKEIAAVKRSHYNFGNTVLPAGMMVAGAGIFILGAVNGLYRKDDKKDWYTTSGLVTGAILLGGGYILTKTRHSIYPIGNRFKLDYLVLNPNKK